MKILMLKRIIPKVLQAPRLKINFVSMHAEYPQALVCMQKEYGVYRLAEDRKFTHVGTKDVDSCINILISSGQKDFFFAHYDPESSFKNIFEEDDEVKEAKTFSVILIGGNFNGALGGDREPSDSLLLKIIKALVFCAKILKITFTIIGQRLQKKFRISSQGSQELKYYATYDLLFKHAEILHRYVFSKELNAENIAAGLPKDIKNISTQSLNLLPGKQFMCLSMFITALAHVDSIICDKESDRLLNALKILDFKNDCARFEQYLIDLFNIGVLDPLYENAEISSHGIQNFLLDLTDFSLTPVLSYFRMPDRYVRSLNCYFEDKIMTQAFAQSGPNEKFKLSDKASAKIAEIKLISYPNRFDPKWEDFIKCPQKMDKEFLLFYLQDTYKIEPKPKPKPKPKSKSKSKSKSSPFQQQYGDAKKLLSSKDFPSSN